MTDNPRVAGPEGPATAPGGPAGGGTADTADAPAERVVIRDNRKIDVNANGSGTAGAGAPDSDGASAADTEVVDVTADEPVEGEVIEVVDVVDVVGEPSGADDAGTETAGEPAAPGLGAELEALRTELEERTRDLQRVTAEYANYRKRVDRDRALVVEQATGNVLGALLPVLDDLDRAREHGDLVGPFGAVAEQLTAALTKFGLTAFGAKGEPFDPTRHEAVAHLTSAEVTEPTCIDVMRRGYLLGERLLRPALVAVADPE